MMRKTIFSVAVGVFTLSSAAMAIYTPSQAYTNKRLVPSELKNDSFQVAQSSINTAVIEDEVNRQINNYRATQGLAALTRNPSIDNQARTHSRNMANGRVPFGHQGFQQRVQNTGLSYTAAAENVAYNQGYSDPATRAVQSWLKSSGHLRNIKGNYNLTGIGVAANGNKIYFTQIFMRSR